MAAKRMPSIRQIRQLLSYDPAAGILTWKPRRRNQFPTGHEWQWKIWNARHANKPAGGLQHGYIKINLNTCFFYAHRLIWLLVHGRPVPNEIDHIDGNRENNRIDNLRPATRVINSINVRTRLNTVTGVKGVNFCKETGRYRVHITRDKKTFRLGRFDTVAEAAAVRRKAATRLHGAFARHE